MAADECGTIMSADSISNAVQRVTDRRLPVDSTDEALQIQRDNPNENMALEDIVKEFELRAVKGGVTLDISGVVHAPMVGTWGISSYFDKSFYPFF